MEIICEFTEIKSRHLDQEIYQCNVLMCEITRPRSVIKDLVAHHVPGKSNFHVEVIVFRDKSVHFFPRGLHQIFIQLTSLSIINCGLKKISRNDLVGLTNLEELNISSNQLSSLPSNLFENMAKLVRISFSDNQLEALTSQLLKPILQNNPTIVSFSRNKKIDAFYRPNISRLVSSLEQLMEIIDASCDKPQEDQPNHLIMAFKHEVSQGFQELWSSQLQSDFTVIVGDKSFKVHKCVLALRSSVFNKIFRDGLKELIVEDYSEAAVEEFLRCLYVGELQDDMNVVELYSLAAKYEVVNLKLIYEQIITQHIDEFNALEIFNLGNLYNSDEIKDSAAAELMKIHPEIDANRELFDDPELLKKIVEEGKSRKRKLL